MNLNDQISKWKDIPGYEGFYQISNTGLIKNIKRSRHLCLSKNGGGYYKVKLRYGKKRDAAVHRLVAETFIENPLCLQQVNHINGIKTDNRVENLEWCTPQENITHAIQIGLKNTIGSNNGSAKLSESDVEEILQLDRMYGLRTRVITKEYHVHKSSVERIKNNITWKNIIRP